MSAKPWVGQSVIIVDDSATVRQELTRMFEQLGMKVKGVAENGLAALNLVKASRPDLVSLDIIMPEMDGVECYKKLRVYDPTIRLMMITWIGGEQKIQDNLKDIIPAHLLHAKGGSVGELETRLGKVYGTIPVAQAQKIGDGISPSDLEALSVRVS